MKRAWIFLLLSVLLVCLLGGCAKEPAATPENGEAGGEAAEEEVFELTIHYIGPEKIPHDQRSNEAAKRIEEETGGRVKINTYFSESLLKYDDTITGTASGVADISFIDSGQFAGQFDLNMVFGRFLPQTPPQTVTTQVFREMIDTIPELNAELEAKGLRWLSAFAVAGEHLHTNGRQVRVPDDVKGMKIAVVGEPARWFESLGAAPVGVAAGDFYMSLERGLVEGQWSHWPAVDAFKLTEVTNCHTLFGENGANLAFTGYIINLKTWESLPPDIQKIMVEAYQWAGDEILKANQAEAESAIASAREKGSTFIELSAEELRLWEETMKSINEEWIASVGAKGLPAEKVFTELFALLDKYGK